MYWWVEWKVSLNNTIISFFPDMILLHFGTPFVTLVFGLSQREAHMQFQAKKNTNMKQSH